MSNIIHALARLGDMATRNAVMFMQRRGVDVDRFGGGSAGIADAVPKNLSSKYAERMRAPLCQNNDPI